MWYGVGMTGPEGAAFDQLMKGLVVATSAAAARMAVVMTLVFMLVLPWWMWCACRAADGVHAASTTNPPSLFTRYHVSAAMFSPT